MSGAESSLELPAMRELHVANPHLGNRAALDAAWERDGYWFFRDVLDKAAVERFRQVYATALGDLGFVDPTDAELRYNGASLASFPPRLYALAELRHWSRFLAEQPIHAFFAQAIGDEPFWVPQVEYRATPPAQDRNRTRFDFIHQDSFYNRGVPFRICWIPLTVIDAQVGGLALAEGLHHGECLHRGDGAKMEGIDPARIPADRWRRATYRPGDVLLMHTNTPHSGLSNHSNRFRVSIDIRLMGRSGQIPLIGPVTTISLSQITVRVDGREKTVAITDETYVRDAQGQTIFGRTILDLYPPGQEAIVYEKNGAATIVRMPQY
jgi:hypothetical protein